MTEPLSCQIEVSAYQSLEACIWVAISRDRKASIVLFWFTSTAINDKFDPKLDEKERPIADSEVEGDAIQFDE